MFLIGHGYAPHITVRNADGTVAFSGPVVFLPEDSTFRSFGVVKVPDAAPEEGSTQLGLEGEFYPTYAFTKGRRGPFSAFPDDQEPGDLDAGLDRRPRPRHGHAAVGLRAGEEGPEAGRARPTASRCASTSPLGGSATLPDGLGTVTFDGVSRYVKLQVSHTPGQKIALAGVVLALIGLLGSLFIRPRRIWVRARREGGRTVVEVAGLDRSAGGDLSGRDRRRWSPRCSQPRLGSHQVPDRQHRRAT